MTWALTYDPAARAKLAAVLQGADPAVVLSVARLHAVLENCPRSVGESREASRRVAFDGPVGIDYELDEPAREVRVTDVRRTDRGADDGPEEPSDAEDDG